MLINADAATIPLQDKSVHTICTSPPYWSLRRYQGEQERDWPAVSYSPLPGLTEITVPAMRCALGLEPDVAAYVGHMILVGRELWRVLRDDGVWWLNLGDSYTSGNSGQRVRQGSGGVTNPHGKIFQSHDIQPSAVANPGRQPIGNNPGNLLMVPHRLALALQGDGWTIRNDCVWHKVAPMPESVSGWRFERHKIKVRSNRPPARQDHLPPGGQRESGQRGNAWSDVQNQPGTEWRDCPGCPKCEANDGYILRRGSWRHTRAHEFVLMCVKSMGYWSNPEVVRERLALPDAADGTRVFGGNTKHGANLDHGHRTQGRIYNNAPSGRNPRSVFHLSSQPYPGAHYAVFPESLIAPLIRATTPAQCCPECGAGWSPMVEKQTSFESGSGKAGNRPDGKWKEFEGSGLIGDSLRMGPIPHTNILGYRPTCDCNAPHRWELLGTITKDNKPMHRCAQCGIGDWTESAQQPCKEPGLVFDPFLGSGTTARVAKELGLRWVGADLSFEYLDLQAKVRAGAGVPSNWADGLPMFEDVPLALD